MLEKEAHMIAAMQSGELEQCLHLFQCNADTLVLPSGKKWQQTDKVISALANIGWSLMQRRSGGAPVPQTPGLINLSHLYVWNESQPYSVSRAYENLCAVLKIFFHGYGVETQTHATPYSYCDGAYNMNINGRKVVGTAQRVLHKKGGGKIVLAQACIILHDDLSRVVQPVNLINELHNIPDRVKAEAHTCLTNHLNLVPSFDEVFNRIIRAFIDSKLY